MNIPEKRLDKFDPQYRNNLKFVERFGLTAFGMVCMVLGAVFTVAIYEFVFQG
jgi:hypothetical protein